MSEVVKFTGNNTELFCRECADSLHASAQVIVPETHTVLLIKDGIVSEALQPGRHDIFDTENGLFRLKKDSDVASVDFVFVSKTAKLQMLWGTSSPIKTRDPLTGVPVSIGANGELEFRVKTPKQFYLELVGADTEYSVDKLKKRIISRLMSVIEPAIAKSMRERNISYTEFTENKAELSEIIKAQMAQMFADEYGLELCSFSINSAIISDADILAIERKRDEIKKNGKTCPTCGKSCTGGTKFCPECGSSLADTYCSNCGTKLAPMDKFCPECGKRKS
ncbi:MAG: SPFH domain-containing protein [Clostridiales bacterium]|nr:SPFH domain-containing protein [Clostridiales bacterium]